MVFIAGVGLYLAMIIAPYQPDESAHVGYALSLRQGDLPSVSTLVPTEAGGGHLEVALSRPWPFANPNVNVANNPPFVYAASLPFVELAIRTYITDGPLLVLRLVDLIGAVAAVGVAYLLGRELSGGDRFVGPVTSGLLSSVIAIGLVSSVAAVDGPALVATTGVTWMTARFARTRALWDATVLGLWCAGAAAVRPMSLVFAAAAGAMAMFLGLRTRGASAFVPLALRLATPTVLLTGWFYALNWHRYGSVAGDYAPSETAAPSLVELLTRPEVSVKPFAYLITEVYGRRPWWWEYQGLRHYLIAAVGTGAVIGAIALARSSRSPRRRGRVVARRLDLQHDARAGAARVDRSTRVERWCQSSAVPVPDPPDRRSGDRSRRQSDQSMAGGRRGRRVRDRADHAHPRRGQRA